MEGIVLGGWAGVGAGPLRSGGGIPGAGGALGASISEERARKGEGGGLKFKFGFRLSSLLCLTDDAFFAIDFSFARLESASVSSRSWSEQGAQGAHTYSETKPGKRRVAR